MKIEASVDLEYEAKSADECQAGNACHCLHYVNVRHVVQRVL